MSEPALSRLAAALMLLFFMGVAALCLYAHQPPAPLPENASATEFSAFRALKHIEAFATAPHRSGTDANFAVRDYLMATLKSMGAEPEVSENTVIRGDRIANPQNVIARLPGVPKSNLGTSRRAFMLCAHYDSVAWGPGASDDGAGVAAMLETYRALKAGPPLQNDIIFLFTDGEETGLMGAQAFKENHPWFKDIGLMVNFEARGTRGLSYLFETSSKNGWLIPHIAQAVPYPVTSSLMYEIYRQMPTSSDYRIFKKDIPGMNVGFIDNLPYYHTLNDSPSNVCLGSLQHHGSYALGFARYFGAMDLNTVATEPSAIYFNLYGKTLVIYPRYLAWPLAGLTAFLVIGIGAIGLFRKRLTLLGIAGGLGIALLTVVATAVGVGAAMAIAYYFRGIYLLYGSSWYMGSSCLLAMAIILGIQILFRRHVSGVALAFASAIFWQAALFAVVSYVPGASYLLAWPLLFGLMGLGMCIIMPESKWTPLFMAVAAVPGILIIVPLIPDFFVAVTVIMAPAVLMLLVLLCGLLAVQVEVIVTPVKRVLPVFLAVAGVILLVVGIATGGFSKSKPKMDCLSYALNVDTGKALWLSTDKKTDEFTSHFFPPGSKRQPISEFGYKKFYLAAEAPVAPLPPPDIQVKADSVANGKRTVSLHIVSRRGAARMDIQCQKPIEMLTINGKQTGKCPTGFNLNYTIFPRAGVDLVIETTRTEKSDATDPIPLTLVDYTYSLPEALDIPAFPPHIITEPNTINFDRPFQSNTSMTAKTFLIPATAPSQT